MRISFRVKFFVVLLAFSLGPLLLSRGIMGRAADRMAGQLSQETRTELLGIVSAELQHNARSLLAILEGHGQAMTLGTYALAVQTMQTIKSAPTGAGDKPYFANDFADPKTAPPDATPSKVYVKQTMSGRTRPTTVSFATSAIYLPQGVNPATVARDIEHLQSLVADIKKVHKELRGGAFTIQIGLESGVMAIYPGRGGFPMRYDFREQEWYRRAKAAPSFAWSTPDVDPTTRQAVAKISYPMRDADGTLLGATAISIPISAMLYEAELKSRWSDDVQSFMVTRHPGDTPANDGLLILAQQSYDNGAQRHWMTGIETEWLTSSDPEAFKEFLVAMKDSPSGVMRLPHDGKESVWAYASNPNFSFLLIAPESVITQLPDQVAGSLNALFGQMRDISAIISGIMLIITGLIAWVGSRAVTKPLLAMATSAKRLAQGDFSVRMTGRTGDERDVLIDSFNDMVPKLKERMHLRRDMELAQEVQNLLLPRTKPVLPGFDISGGIAYCDQTGGDYIDFIEVINDKGKALSVVLGDVSGHGVPSALLMATARGQLHTLSRIFMRPEQRIGVINTSLSRDMDGTGRFLTLFYLRLKENDPQVRWVRAGHDPAIRYTPQTDRFGELSGEGLALGITEDSIYEGYDATLTEGEVLVLATDGVWEARNGKGIMFGKKRMLAIIRENAHTSAEGIRTALMNAVAEYQANGQEDDIAVVVIKKV